MATRTSFVLARQSGLLVLGLLCLPVAGCGENSEDGSVPGPSPGQPDAGLDGSSDADVVEPPLITGLSPSEHAGGEAFTLTVEGFELLPTDVVLLDELALSTSFVSAQQLQADVPAQKRGVYDVSVSRGQFQSAVLPLTITNTAPVLTEPTTQTVAEDSALSLTVVVDDFDDDSLRVFATGLPPGAIWDEAARQLTLQPDFIQGGDDWNVALQVTDGIATVTGGFTVTVQDTISPPAPTISNETTHSDHVRLTLSQTTDTYLDSPGYAGRSFEARAVVPTDASAQNRYPVRVYLHGFGGSPYTGGTGDQFRIYAHDPDNTYWWGYSDQLPSGNPTTGTVPNYTQRRVLHLLEWVLRTYPGADPNRVYATGGSMGGAGSAALGLLYARHFCYVHSTIGQVIPRNHRPARISQLSTLWVSPADNLPDAFGMGNWDRGDLTRALVGVPEARNQFIYTKHGKDDSTIHFGAVVMDSPLTGLSFFDAAQNERIGHYVVWDEGGHGSNDPVMGSHWWDDDFSLIFDTTTYLRRDLPFPAFTHCAIDRDPGDGTGNGQQTWSDSAGYAGTVSVVGDTGWSGDIAGTRNRYLRWDSTNIIDTIDQLAMPLKVLDGTGEDPPQTGYPPKYDQLDDPLPVTVDVTVRRAQSFRCLAGEVLDWEFGTSNGSVTANQDGSVTVPALALTGTYTTLVLTRHEQ